MTKISGLTQLTTEEIDGNETVPVVKDGANRRAALSALVAPWLALVESLLGPTYADVPAALAATNVGESFAVDNGDGTVTIWYHDAGDVAAFPRTLATTAYLGSAAGAGAIGKLGGGSIQDAVDDLTLLGKLVGPAGSQAFVANYDVNRYAADVSASMVFGGTPTQPNAIGKTTYSYEEISDGVKTVYSLAVGAVVTDTTWVNIRVFTIRPTTGLSHDSWTEGAGFTVTDGYGTDTIEITLDAPATSGDRVIFIVQTDVDTPTPLNNEHTLQAVFGYDNSSSGVANISFCFHGHTVPGANHIYNAGGSYKLTGGAYTGNIAGSGNFVGVRYASAGAVNIGGRGNRLDGNDLYGGGIGNDIYGANAAYSGSFHKVMGNPAHFLLSGRRGEITNTGDVVHGLGQITDEAGTRMLVKAGWQRDIASGAQTDLMTLNGGTTLNLPLKSVWSGRLFVSIIGPDGSKMASFAMDAMATRDAAGLSRLNGLTTDVAVPEVSNVGAPGYSVNFRAAGAGLLVRVTAEAGARAVAEFSGPRVRQNA